VEPVELKGRWWLPDRPDQHVNGTLRFTADEFLLDLDEDLVPIEDPAVSEGVQDIFVPMSAPVIFGDLRSGESVTLVDCDGWRWNTPLGRDTPPLHPSAALRGDQLAGERLRFDGVSGIFDYAVDWAKPPDIKYDIDFDNGEPSKIWAAAENRLLAVAELRGARVELKLQHPYKMSGEQIEIGRAVRFDITFDRPCGWKEAVDRWIWPLRDLVSLGTTRANRAEHIGLRVSEPTEPRDPWVRLLVPLSDARRPKRAERELFPHEMLFTVGELPDSFGASLEAWLNSYDKLGPAVSILLGIEYAPFVWADSRFLAIAQTAEILHRVILKGRPLTKKEHARRVAAVKLAVGEGEVADWAVDILHPANYLHLRDRLARLLAKGGGIGEDVLAASPDFVTWIVRTRNHLTHRDPKVKHLEGLEREVFGETLRWVARFWLTTQVGFERDQAATLLRRNYRYNRTIEHLAECSSRLTSN